MRRKRRKRQTSEACFLTGLDDHERDESEERKSAHDQPRNCCCWMRSCSLWCCYCCSLWKWMRRCHLPWPYGPHDCAIQTSS